MAGWRAKAGYPLGYKIPSTYQTAHYLDEDCVPACATPSVRFTCTWKPLESEADTHFCSTCIRLREPTRSCRCAECAQKSKTGEAKQLRELSWLLIETSRKLRAQRAPVDIRDRLTAIADSVDQLLDACHTRGR